MSPLTQDKVMEALDFAYTTAVNGMPGVASMEALGTSYLQAFRTGKLATLQNAASTLVHRQSAKSATSGFLTGLGGLLAMPITIPANVASVYFIQLRMVGAIAHMAGYDVRDERVKALIYSCLVGSAVKQVLTDVGIQLGKRLAQRVSQQPSGELVTKVNQAVGVRLLERAGINGALRLSKVIPLVGGLVGATVDAAATNRVGKNAIEMFIYGSIEID